MYGGIADPRAGYIHVSYRYVTGRNQGFKNFVLMQQKMAAGETQRRR